MSAGLLTKGFWQVWTRDVREKWPAHSLRGRFLRGAVWTGMGAVASQGSTLVASIVVARLLGREEFGRYGIIQSTVGMLGIFAGLGLGVTATKYIAEFRSRDPERAGRIIALCTLIAVLSGALMGGLLLLFAPVFATRTLNAPDLTAELRIASLLLFANAINGAQTGALSGFEAFRDIAQINTVRGIAALPLITICVIFGGLRGAIWGLVFAMSVPCLLSYFALRRHCKKFAIYPRYREGLQERRLIWTFSTPAFLSGALVGPALWAANTFLVNQPGGYGEMGLYSAASQWRNAIAFVPGVLANFALPLLSNLRGQDNSTAYRKMFRVNFLVAAGSAVLVAAPIAIAAPWIMQLYGRTFQHGSLVLVLSSITAVVTCINNVIGTAILSAGNVWIGFAFNAMWAAVLIVSALYLVPAYLSVGLAAATLFAYAAHSCWQMAYLYRRL